MTPFFLMEHQKHLRTKAQEKGKRARKHPIWDDPALGVERMNAVLIQSSADALDAEGKEAVTEEQRKKNADQAAAVSLLDARAAALQTKEAARKVPKSN
ncbi:hypothetical protein CYMTET_55748 [Cymbomonas tetramitiformis]|uniref:Uncharacterized protein n=1 Tax=Cymbomonas tetramitiformis TaxID=36881 RepID=A0AAE0BCN7_9CHLO|nr:hypothetical protein CYMTET_55748 [Cymbomonas tetramitiformis]